MKDITKSSPGTHDNQLNADVLRRHRDEDIRDDDMITSDRIADSKLPTADPDDDDANLSDDAKTGRDLAIENADEWDAGNMGDDLDRMDLDDDDEINSDKHRIKSDQFGSLGKSLKNENDPTPAEAPAPNQPNTREVTQPRQDTMENGQKNEADYKHTKEVTPPQPEHERKVTTDEVNPPNTGVDHPRTTERIADHEPGNVASDRRAPNL